MYTESRKVLTAASPSLRSWLRNQLLAATASYVAAGLFCLVLAAGAAVATFFAVYSVGFMIFARGRSVAQLLDFDPGRPAHQFLLITAAIVEALLFITFFLKDRDDRQRPFALKRKSVAQTIARVLLDVIYVAPQLFKLALDFLNKGIRLSLIDRAACAGVLTVLAEHPGRVSYSSIANALNLERPVRTFRQVSLIDGVVVLTSEPYGLSLTADLREELLHFAGQGNSSEEPQTVFEPDAEDEFVWCCRILNINSTAGLQEARKAYRKLIKENHPDLVYGLGPELEHIAVEKSKEINKAYDTFVRRLDQRAA